MAEMAKNDWEEVKNELKGLALAIKGSTREEFPANLANLEDCVCRQLKKTALKTLRENSNHLLEAL